MPSVTVDLRVSTTAGTDVEILDTAADSRAGHIVCSVNLPASTLYTNTSSGVFEIWEPSSARGTLKGAVAGEDGSPEFSTVTQAHPGLAAGLLASLAGTLTAQASTPIVGGYPADYWGMAGIGNLAVAYAAHNLFGHVAATAAITNEVDILAHMVGAAAPNAALGTALEAAIIALSAANASLIANVVIGQDAERTRDEDNNEYAPNSARALKFYAGDIVFVGVELTGFSSSTGEIQAYNPNSFAAQQFYFRITLS
jgi:hypothetical protein